MVCAANFIIDAMRRKEEKMKKTRNSTQKLVESSVMIAFATVLSMLKLVDMPYGGSVTAVSMLPIVIISYRQGILWGLGSGAVYATVQQLLGLNTLSYVTGWQSMLAVIALDYALAFTLIGLGGIFKGRLSRLSGTAPKRQSTELILGTVLVCVLRYLCHTVAGATVWAGLSIPTEAALIYSIGYNATYMLPETVVTALAAGWIGGVLDLSKATPERFAPAASTDCEGSGTCEVFPHLITLITVITVAVDTVLIAPYLQNGESGEFDFSAIGDAPWLAVGIVSAVGIIAVLITFFARKSTSKDKSNVA